MFKLVRFAYILLQWSDPVSGRVSCTRPDSESLSLSHHFGRFTFQSSVYHNDARDIPDK